MRLINWRINNMKTVMDAVNEFKGEWKYPSCEAIYFRGNRGHKTYYYYGEDKPFNAEYICSKEQFNNCVVMYSTNIGRDSLKHLHVWQEEIKQMNKIDWDKAPEGATHYWENMNSFYKFSKHDNDFVWQNCEWQRCSDIDCFEGCLTPKPSQTIFTNCTIDYLHLNTHYQ